MSGGSNKAANEANRMEQERQASIRRTQGAVNAVFDSPQRAAEIGDFVGAMRQFYGDDLNRQQAVDNRERKFALARGGLTGGSVNVDMNRTAGEDYQRGLLEVDRRARGAGAELEAADQDARSRLISLATSGLDVTTGASQAAAAMRTQLEAGRAGAQAQQLGDIFGRSAKWYGDSAEAAVRRRADRDFGLYKPTAATSPYFGGKP